MLVLIYSYRFLLPFTVMVIMVMTAPVLAEEAIHAVEHDPPQLEQTGMSSLTQHLFMQLPRALNPRQQAEAINILSEAGPRISEAQGRVAAILEKLRDLSFSAHSQPDTLSELGQELVIARDALRAELRRVSENLEKGIGLNPRWDAPRSCAMPQAVQDEAVPKN